MLGSLKGEEGTKGEMIGRGRSVGTGKRRISLRYRGRSPACGKWLGGWCKVSPVSRPCRSPGTERANSRGWRDPGVVGDSREEMGGITGLREALPPIDHEPG